MPDRIEIEIGDKALVFRVEFESDNDSGAPWDNEDGHGPVSDWELRSKRPGELVLNTDRTSKRFYDFKAACALALAEGWDARPYNEGNETKRQQAAKAAMADFEHLRKWCANEWQYVGVIVTLLDDAGEPTEVRESLWGLEDSDTDNLKSEAKTIADDLAHGYGVSWGEVSKTTFGYLKGATA